MFHSFDTRLAKAWLRLRQPPAMARNAVFLGLLLSLLPGMSPGFSAPPDVPTLSSAAQLFVDLERIETLENVRQVFHQPKKHPANPVLRKEKPWETLYGTWGTVLRDPADELFKVWYGGSGRATGIDRPGFARVRSVLLYATSRDGIQWIRPELGLFPVDGTVRNNVVVGDEHHKGMDHWESVLRDADDPDAQRRFKAIGWSSDDWDGPRSGIYSMTSPDGLHWTHSPEPIFHYHPRPGTNDLGPIGDAQSLMIDTLRRRYVAFLRTVPHRSMSESTDFIHWTPPRVSIEARAGESSNMLYNHQGFVYGDQYLGFLTYFDRHPTNPLCTVRLISSRDGDTWQRPAESPFIDVGAVGEPDRFLNMLTGGPPVRVGDELYIYYRVLAVRHGPYEGRDDTGREYPGGIALARLRLDGFAALEASYDGGTATTRPFRFSGSRLHVNVKSDFGKLRVEVLDDAGNPIAGYGKSDCRPVESDGVHQPVGWKDRDDLAALKGRGIRLRFHLENARLYSYRIE